MRMRKRMKKWIVGCMAVFLMLAAVACQKSVAAQMAEQLELGQQYLLEQEYEQAVVAFQKAIELEPNTKEAYYGLGQSYEGLAGKSGEDQKEEQTAYFAQAEEAYLQVLQMDALDSDACTRLIAVYENTGELEKLAALGSYYHGETADAELLRRIEEAGTCLGVVQQIAELCEAGNVEEVFTLLQSGDYQKLKELSSRLQSPVFLVRNGVGIGLYRVNTERYGVNQFVYYGGFADSLRQGHGLWFGYDNGNNYYASGEWSGDLPNGEQEVREWGSLLDETNFTRVIEQGVVVNGLWNGPARWIYEEKDGTAYDYPVSFTNGKWNILNVYQHEGRTVYSVHESMDIENPDEIVGILGFLDNDSDRSEEILETLPEDIGTVSTEEENTGEDAQESWEYTLDELTQMVVDYRERHGLYRTQYVRVDHEDGEMVTFQCYDVITDEETGDSHTATSDWYTISRYTAAGYDLNFDDVDLTE